MFNQKVIENNELIKEIESKGEFICKQKPHYVCVPTEDLYYYHNNNIIRIQKTVERTEEDALNFKNALSNARFKTEDESNIETIKEYLKNIEIEPIESEVVECVQENLLSIESEVIPYLMNTKIFETDRSKIIEILKQMNDRFNQEDVKNNTTVVMVNASTSIDGFVTYSNINCEKFVLRDDVVDMKSKDRSGITFVVRNDNVGIAHEIIDEYREIYKIYSGKDDENCISISILFANRERRGFFYGTIN